MQGLPKALILWLCVITLFIGLYWQLNGGSLAVFAVVVPGLVALILLIVGVIWLRNRRPWVRMSRAAWEAFQQGLYGKSVELWSAAAEASPNEMTVRVTLATARLYLWQIRKAQAELNALDRILARSRETVAPAYRSGLLAQRALVAALDNRLPDARGFLLEGGGQTPVTALATAVMELREGQVDRASRLLRGPLVDQLGGPLARLARALDAWCIHHQSGQQRHVDKVGLFAEAAQDGMREAWPEFMAFLEGAPQA